MSEGHFFISFSQENMSFVHELVRQLRTEAGLDVWYYPEQPVGAEFVPHLMQAIEQAQAVILVLSRASAHSVFVLNEILHTRKHRRRIIPVYIEPCNGPVCILVNHLHRIQLQAGQNPVPPILEALNLPFFLGTEFPVGELTVLEAYHKWASPAGSCYLEIPPPVMPFELPTELGRWNIGRLPVPGNYLAINRDFVSRNHAYLRVYIETNSVSFLLYDESRFGTYVNGQRVKTSCVLNEGDEIGLGKPHAMLRFAYSSKTQMPDTTTSSHLSAKELNG